MPVNKHALIRYKTIDNCLRNRYRRWTIEDLVKACSDALYDYEGKINNVSLRTVQLDIQNMRSEKLGYNAPIVVLEKKYYTYEDPDFSITNIPLTQQDLHTLEEAVDMLKQFKGFGYFQELSGMVSRLEDKVLRQKNKGRAYIQFEKNDLLKGLEFIDPLQKAITEMQAIEINYKSFKSRSATTIILHPYLLKEYRNRWFVIGANTKGLILNLALDRIISFDKAQSTPFIPNTFFDIETYYDDVIGVTKSPNLRPSTVVLRVHQSVKPYVITKPIHHSQKLLKEDKVFSLFSINVILNFELEREILGFGESVKVLSPRRLKNTISNRLKKAADNYVHDGGKEELFVEE